MLRRVCLLYTSSMGAATVLMAAGEQPENLKGVIADCGFTSALEEFRHVLHEYYHLPAFPFLPVASAICKLRAGYTFAQCSAQAVSYTHLLAQQEQQEPPARQVLLEQQVQLAREEPPVQPAPLVPQGREVRTEKMV